MLANQSFGSESSGDEEGCSPQRVQSDLVLGLLPNGQSFSVPDTYSVVESLREKKSLLNPGTQVWILSVLFTSATSLGYYYGILPPWYFVVQFMLWRMAYNVGLGHILNEQSKSRKFQEWYRSFVRSPARRILFERAVALRNPSIPFHTTEFPEEFCAWMFFRYLVNLVLANDLFAYFALVLVYWEPMDIHDFANWIRVVLGFSLALFALWSKADAHRVLGDYAWYWGDFFFLLDKSLVFDGIFQMFPHPMYTVGYAFMYGASLMSQSYTAFYLSVWCHVMQLLFLVLIEDPHIQKTYGSYATQEESRDWKLDDYFENRELIVFLNLDPIRYGDVVVLLLLLYNLVMLWAVESVWFHIGHYVFWRLVKTLYLGSILREQSLHHSWSQRFRSPQEAFSNWKKLYNTTVVMTNATFVICCLKCLDWANLDWQLWCLHLTVGCLLIAVNGYVSWSVFDAIGEYGYFFGDFFIEDVPAKLTYHGVYRYLNNPETSVGFAGYYGLAVISASWTVGVLAALSHGCAKLFEKFVETPHMQRLYGSDRRSQGGLQRELVARGQSMRKKLLERQQKLKTQYEAQMLRLRREVEQTRQGYERVEENVRRLSADRKKKK